MGRKKGRMTGAILRIRALNGVSLDLFHQKGWLFERWCNSFTKTQLYQLYCTGNWSCLLLYYFCSSYEDCNGRLSIWWLYYLWSYGCWFYMLNHRIIKENRKENTTNYFINFVAFFSNLFCIMDYSIVHWCYWLCSLSIKWFFKKRAQFRNNTCLRLIPRSSQLIE